MRALITLVIAAALTAASPVVAGAEHACAPPPPKSSQYRTGPVGPAEARGGPNHAGATLGGSYLFVDGDPNGGLVYGQAAVDVRVGPYYIANGPEFRVGGASTACVEPYR